MNAFIVPCTQEKVWDANPSAGKVAAKDAYTKATFLTWRRFAEQSGSPWFILSTKYRLIRPDQLIDKYNVPVSRAVVDRRLLARLKEQGAQLGFEKFERVVLLDWERFEPLVRAALPNQQQYELKRLVYLRDGPNALTNQNARTKAETAPKRVAGRAQPELTRASTGLRSRAPAAAIGLYLQTTRSLRTRSAFSDDDQGPTPPGQSPGSLRHRTSRATIASCRRAL